MSVGKSCWETTAEDLVRGKRIARTDNNVEWYFERLPNVIVNDQRLDFLSSLNRSSLAGPLPGQADPVPQPPPDPGQDEPDPAAGCYLQEYKLV